MKVILTNNNFKIILDTLKERARKLYERKEWDAYELICDFTHDLLFMEIHEIAIPDYLKNELYRALQDYKFNALVDMDIYQNRIYGQLREQDYYTALDIIKTIEVDSTMELLNTIKEEI